VTEYVLVDRKRTDLLIDWFIRNHPDKQVVEDSKVPDGYKRANVWKINPAINSKHPAAFPKELAEKVVRYYSFKGDVVLDPFAGSGTVGQAAAGLDRRFVWFELNPDYVEITREEIKFWKNVNLNHVMYLNRQSPISTSMPFHLPRYDGHCFANLPGTIQYWLTGAGAPGFAPEIMAGFEKRYETVIVLFVDALGWQFVERFGDEAFVQAFARAGRIAPTTAQFPSTTAAHVTCIHTGLPLAQSGVYEWFYYDPTVDAVIAPLLYSFAGDKERDTLRKHADPAQLYPTTTLYQTLKAQGVTSHIFQQRDYTPSTFSDVVFRGAEVFGFKTLPEALVTLSATLARQQTPRYIFLYYDKVDAIGHEYGPHSAQMDAEIVTFGLILERFFGEVWRKKLRNALLVLVADHGQARVDPRATVYLNHLAALKDLPRWLKTNRRGQPLVPAGSPRDLFLYVKPAHVAEAHAALQAQLSGIAEIHRAQTLLEQGVFGPGPFSPRFLERLADLVILPFDHDTIWWHEKDRFEMKYFGHHGGLSLAEMQTPLMLMEL
jgi:predicted AlkP superfamily pyrophosphatase or phosphodiesterase